MRTEDRFQNIIRLVDRQTTWFSIKELVESADGEIASTTARRIVEKLVRMGAVKKIDKGFNARNYKVDRLNWTSVPHVIEDYGWWTQVEDGRRGAKSESNRSKAAARQDRD